MGAHTQSEQHGRASDSLTHYKEFPRGKEAKSGYRGFRSSIASLAAYGLSDVVTGVWGEMSLTFCQDGARDFFEKDEKISEGVVANLQRKRAWAKSFIYAPTFITLATPLYGLRLNLNTLMRESKFALHRKAVLGPSS